MDGAGIGSNTDGDGDISLDSGRGSSTRSTQTDGSYEPRYNENMQVDSEGGEPSRKSVRNVDKQGNVVFDEIRMQQDIDFLSGSETID